MALLVTAVLTPVAFSFADSGAAHQAAQTVPVKLGTSGGNVKDISKAFCCSGTLGALVSRGGKSYVLSNNHVLARSGTAVAGEDVSQPGLIDNGCLPRTLVAHYSLAAPLGSSNVGHTSCCCRRACLTGRAVAQIDAHCPCRGT